jgi:hypothetical protein
MPNYRIPNSIAEALRDTALSHCHKAVRLSLTGFPLSHEDIQYSGLALTRDQVDTLRNYYINHHVNTIQRMSVVNMLLLPDVLPGLRRGILLSVRPHAVQLFFAGRWTDSMSSKPRFDRNAETYYMTPDFANITPTQRQQFANWANKALLQARLYEVASLLSRQVLMGGVAAGAVLAPTTCHLQAMWPLLATMLDPAREPNRTARLHLEQWKQKLRTQPTRDRKRYLPEPHMAQQLDSLIKAADTQILAGMMLDDEPPTSTSHLDLRVEIKSWERLPGDRTVPVKLSVPQGASATARQGASATARQGASATARQGASATARQGAPL